MYRRVLSPPTPLFLVVVLGIVFDGSKDPGDLSLFPARDIFTQGFRHGFLLGPTAADGDGFFHQRRVEVEICVENWRRSADLAGQRIRRAVTVNGAPLNAWNTPLISSPRYGLRQIAAAAVALQGSW